MLAEGGSSSDSAAIAQLKQAIAAQRERTDQLAAKLEALEAKQTATAKTANAIQAGRVTAANETLLKGLKPSEIYNHGFFVKTEDNSFSLFINGLMQARFTAFKPNAVGSFGARDSYENTFDLYLGRIAFSGNVFDPETKYFFQIQGSTAGNSNTISMLDWFATRTISPYLTLKVGRSWLPYTYEYYDNPGNYLLPDLSAAEYAFLLQRGIGIQANGHAGRLGYGIGMYNSIPALDAGGQESINGHLAYVGNLYFNILKPYGWVETDPSPTPVSSPELTVWASGMYNPVDYSSGLQNAVAGDRTYGGTSSILFRYNYFSFQGSGYYRRTNPTGSLGSYNSWGYGEQAGYYVIPAKLELAERVSGVWWGKGEIPATGGSETVWYDGPTNFSYHRITEYTIGWNYYIHGHNAKIQAAYSYLAGKGFAPRSGFGASRLWIQAQLMF